jgi:hypothetical protein
MKKLILITICAFVSFAFADNNENNSLMCFDFYDDVDFDKPFQKVYMEDLKADAFLIQMKNSEDILITIKSEQGLKPIIFANYKDNYILYKDINNRKTTIQLNLISNNSGTYITNVKYFESNDSKRELALAGGCLGGSTSACIELAVEACMSDGWCTITCGLTFPQCVSAIALACAYNCNVQ